MIVQTTPARVIGDKAYDSDRLDELLAAQGIETIAPNRLNRSKPKTAQPATRQKTLEGRTHHRLAPKLSPTLHSLEKSHLAFQGFLHMACALLLIKEVLG